MGAEGHKTERMTINWGKVLHPCLIARDHPEKKVISFSLVPHQASEAYCNSCTLVIRVRSFGTHLHLSPELKSAPLGRHFRSNEEVRQDLKNFLRSLGTDFYKEGFSKLISRYGKCIKLGG
ncbi:hypothetical protein AVEN_97803-1 [Araneus ventricosus]|uniref:Uncharacterized protein n=1 Tax=Araneus ventricosus TaxID=182803 RepID=A0A4Y2UR08_ARAVE|nr:hypothetical protein AVEN_97803-1 [Araneus ventricosus]